MTFTDICIMCGGPVLQYDEETARCVGYCRSKQEPIESMTLAQYQRMRKIMKRVRAIAAAKTVDVKRDVL